MTRGQIAIIYQGYGENQISIMTSIEFNGDMYMKGGHGPEVVRQLKKVNDVADYQYIVAKFNCDHHHYNDCDKLTYVSKGLEVERMLDFSKDYFANWFSDYIYLKNITELEVKITCEKWDKKTDKVVGTEVITLQPNDIVVLNFGSLHKIYQAQK